MLHEPLLDKISKMHNSTRLVRDPHKSHVQRAERKHGAMTPAQNNPDEGPPEQVEKMAPNPLALTIGSICSSPLGLA